MRVRLPLLLSVVVLWSPIASAQQYWNTNGASSTLTANNWGTSASGPFTNAYTAGGEINFTANSAITNVTNTVVGNFVVADGVTVNWTAAGTMTTGGNVRTLTVGTGSVLDFAAQNISTTAGTGIVKNGAGILFSANGNTYGGGFTLNEGTVIVGGVNAMGGATGNTLTINGGTITANNTRNLSGKYAGGITVGGNFTLGGATTGVTSGNGTASASLTFSDAVSLGSAVRTINLGGTGLYTFGGVVSGTGGITLSNSAGGGGRLVLSGASTYAGATTVNGGILRAGVASVANTSGAFGLNSNVSLANTAGATLDLNGFNTQIGSLSGGGATGGNVTLGAGTLSVGGGTASGSTATYAGAISGTGGVTKVGSGVQVVSGANDYTGVTTVTAGTLLFNTTASLYNGVEANWNTSNLVVNSAGVLAVTLGGANGFTATQVQAINQISGGGGGFLANSYLGIDTSNGSQTYANVITDAGSTVIGLAKHGANTLTLTATNTYTLNSNGTRVFGGTLQVGDGGTTGRLGGGSVNVSSGATLAFNRSDDLTFAGNISGAGGLTQLGNGVVTLSTAKTYSGATVVNAGTLKLGSSGAINNTSTISVASGATYDVSAVTGGYTLGSGTTQELFGTGTVSGGVTVAANSIIFGGNGTNTGTLTTGNVTVQSGGRLGVRLGTGTTASQLNTSAGILNLNSGAIIDPNGTFTDEGNRTLAALSSGSGGLVVNGANVDTDAEIATYTYATGDTGLKPFGVLQLDVTGLGLTQGDQLALSRSGNNLVLSFTPVPEPGLMLAVCGLAVGGVVGLRKWRRKGKPADVTPAA